MVETRATALAVVLAVIVVAFHVPASAGLITLTSGDSKMELDPASAAGVLDWQIGGVSHLSQQWFWFRADLDGFDDREYSIHEIDDTPDILQLPAMPNLARIAYSDDRIKVELTYLLVSGPGLWSADLAEIIKITNLAEATIELDFFQFSDFDLNDDEHDDEIHVTGGNTSVQTDGGSGASLAETIVGRSPELSEVATGTETLDKLQDADADDLDGTTASVGPADLTWAFQWKDREIHPGESLVISKDKVLVTQPVAEPGTLGLTALAVFAALGRRRRRSRA